MTQEEYNRLREQSATLKEVSESYPGRTIENIITNIDARVRNCEKHLPWTTTSKGEITDACVDYEKHTIKRCDGCREERA